MNNIIPNIDEYSSALDYSFQEKEDLHNYFGDLGSFELLDNNINNCFDIKEEIFDFKEDENSDEKGNEMEFPISKYNSITEKNKKTNHSTEKKLGRKRNNCEKIDGKHNRFTDDNLIRRIKSTIINVLITYINKIIDKTYNNNFVLFSDCNKMELLKINYTQVIKSKADYNKDFLYKSLRDIFSVDITTKYKHYNHDHNKILINNLLYQKDEQKRNLFTNLFNLTFLECIEHIRGTKYIMELSLYNGVSILKDICKIKNFEKDKDYTKKFKYYILNLEKIIEIKKVRNRAKNGKKEDISIIIQNFIK